jgi:uncharacterized phiE125 gp8 family phage protein
MYMYDRGCTDYYQYKVAVPPVNLPLDLTFVKNYLKIDGVDDDALITFLIKSVASYVEKYTGRTLINTQYQTYRNNFGVYESYYGYVYTAQCCGIELKKSPFVSLDSFTYLNKDNVETVVDSSLYYVTDKTDYSSILLLPDKQYPSDVLCVQQAVKILFTAGYGIDETTIPTDLQEAMLQLVADLYTNRGDCTTSMSCACNNFVTAASKAILDSYRILNL